jgi:hypothetical protein
MSSRSVNIEKIDECRIIRAYETLRSLNEKYGKPYGNSPVGIVFAVYKVIGFNN